MPPPDRRHQCCVAGMTAPLHGRLSTSTITSTAAATAAVTVVLLNCAVCALKAPRPSTTTTDNPPLVYLTRGMIDKIDCPAKAKPPTTLIVWSRNQHVLDTTSSNRLNIDKRGALLIDNVTSEDAGLYTCTQYSPLKNRHPNFNLSVVVKGLLHLLHVACLFFSLSLFFLFLFSLLSLCSHDANEVVITIPSGFVR